MSESEFISTEEGAISTALNTYLERNGLIPGPGHLIILDMEPHYSDPSNPEEQISFSPGNLGRYEDDPELQSSLIRAYVRRILVAKEVLKQRWPAVKLGLYGVVVPDGRGEEDARFDQRMRGYRRAGELGMYDFVDSLVPVLYNRFGPSDVPLPGGDAYLERLNAWVGRSTRQALVNSQRLTRRNGRTVPLTPVLTFWVANGNSAHNDRVVAPETMSLQLAIVQEYCPVRAIVFWSGPETIEEMRESGRQPLQFVDFLARVEGLPPPRCR